MKKRILSLILCLATILGTVAIFAGCSTLKGDDKGQYIKMYYSDSIYDLDPANAYYNDEAANIVGLLYDTLFKLNDNGKVKKSLVKKYKIYEDSREDEWKMSITLNKTYWSDGTYLSADDVVFAWRRLVDVENSFEAACLIYDIKNARAIKQGECTIDDIGLEAQQDELDITFEGKIDFDQFLLNLTSVALAPLRETVVTKSEDWAKKSSTIACSGPFRLGKVKVCEGDNTYYDYTNIKYNTDPDDGHLISYQQSPAKLDETLIESFILERNSYYYRNREKDALDKYVVPYRIVVDCSLTDEELKAAYEDGEILYVGNIPLSLREYYADEAKVSDALSTHLYYLNENQLVKTRGNSEGTLLFQNKKVRQLLSYAIDRDAIAKAIVFAEAATALVPGGVFNTTSAKKEFRSVGGAILSKTADDTKVQALLSELSSEGIRPSDYTFSITVAAYNEVHVKIAEMVAEAWSDLGFNVSVKKIGTITNNDWYTPTSSVPADICDDLYAELLRRGEFDVIALDYRSLSADAFSMLAQYATAFSGKKLDMSNPEGAEVLTHITGYSSEDYNTLMEAIYFLPYFSSITAADWERFAACESEEAFAELLAKIKDIYTANGINPAKSKKWASARAKLLHKAEELLMEDMPVIPIIFNKSAVLYNKQLKNVVFKDSNIFTAKGSYYFPADFRNARVKKYDSYKDKYLAEYYEDQTTTPAK